MQKLKNSVLNKMIQTHLTKAEVDFILEISHYQTDKGIVYGVYYKNICETIGISYETFYVTMKSLVEKGLIALKKSEYGDQDIVIRDNDFSYNGALKEGYISTGHDIFYNEEFKKLKANEKLLILQLIKIVGVNGRYLLDTNIFYEKYSKLLQVSTRTIQVYLSRIKQFFTFKIVGKKYRIKALDNVFKDSAPTDLDNLSKHLGRVACRRNKATYTKDNFKDTIELVGQYASKVKDIAAVFLKSVKSSIENNNEHVRQRRKWDRRLNPAFVHELILHEI